MANPIPSAVALATINDSSLITASPHRNNYAAIQAAVNALIAALSGGTVGQRLKAVDGTDVVWATTGYISLTSITNPTTSYTAPAGATLLQTQLCGGGGAGGGAVGTAGGQVSAGGGGGAAATAMKDVTVNIGTHVVAVGLGGSQVVGGSGGPGGTSTFKDTTAAIVCQAGGGLGGLVGTIGQHAAGGNTNNTGTGDAVFQGTPGAPSNASVAGGITSGNGGGSSGFGGGGQGVALTGGAGTGGGGGPGGGGGSANEVSQVTASQGGAGGNGQILVRAYG